MITLYSDEWIQKGYLKSKRYRLKVANPIDYVIWLDKDDRPVGVGINFEYADDVHFEFIYEDFLKMIAFLGSGNDFMLTLSNYFEGRNIFDFIHFLDNNSIIYRKIAYFSIDF